VTVVENLEQIAPLFDGQVGKPPVVENEEFDPGDGLQQPSVATVTAGERERVE
jgi:hypothetical protein